MTDNKVFFISDTHLDHRNIINYCSRPFGSVEEMNRVIVRNWNETVGEDDVVCFLGDLACGRGSRKAWYWLNKLNGFVVFIAGSHDDLAGIKFYHWLILNHGGHRFFMTHRPWDVPITWKFWAICGHSHNNPNFPLLNRKDKMINVSAENLNYTPIELEELLSNL